MDATQNENNTRDAATQKSAAKPILILKADAAPNPEPPAIASNYIANYQKDPLVTAGKHVQAEQSSWLVTRKDIELLTSVAGYDHIHIFLGRTDPAVPEKITLVLAPVAGLKHVPFSISGVDYFSEMVIPCPECYVGGVSVPYKYDDLDF